MPGISNWVYGQNPNLPYGQAQYGNVVYSYASSSNGPFQSAVPTTAGTWYVKAEVVGTDQYSSLVDIRPFVIEKAQPSYVLPSDLTAKAYSKLSDIILPSGFTWKNQDQLLDRGGQQVFEATYTPMDQVNYHSVNVLITVFVEKVQNQWLSTFSIENVDFGQGLTYQVESRYGQPYLVYSASKDGEYTTTVPVDAGVYYAKAIIDATDMYEGLETEPVPFVINAKTVQQESIVKPTIDINTDLDALNLQMGETTLLNGKDFTITSKKTNNLIYVTITFQGNYTGTLNYTYELPKQEDTVVNIPQKEEGKQEIVETDSKQEEQKENHVFTSASTHGTLYSVMSILSLGALSVLAYLKKKTKNID